MVVSEGNMCSTGMKGMREPSSIQVCRKRSIAEYISGYLQDLSDAGEGGECGDAFEREVCVVG